MLYESGDDIVAVAYAASGDAFIPGRRRVWLSKFGGGNWDLDPTRDRIVVLKPVATAPAAPPKPEHTVMLLQNFLDELRRRVPIHSRA